MPDRSLRLLTFPPQSVLLRERPSSPPDAPSDGKSGSGQDDNPFAPPPEGTPDRPWQPRRPEGGEGGDAPQGDGGHSPWGSQWSDQQPGRSQGGFGDRPGRQGGPGNQGGPEGPGGGPGQEACAGTRRTRHSAARGTRC